MIFLSVIESYRKNILPSRVLPDEVEHAQLGFQSSLGLTQVSDL